MAKWRMLLSTSRKPARWGEHALDFRSSLPGGFRAPLKRKVKTMKSIKCGVTIGDKTLYDMASLFCRPITVGQHRQVELQTLFDYKLCAVPASINYEYGCLRTGTKSTLFSKLKVDDLQLDAPDIIIVDGQQLIYHIVWPCAGSASDLANSKKDRLGQYHPTEVLVIFDRYDDRSAKDHERIRRQIKRLLTTILQHQASSHAATPS